MIETHQKKCYMIFLEILKEKSYFFFHDLNLQDLKKIYNEVVKVVVEKPHQWFLFLKGLPGLIGSCFTTTGAIIPTDGVITPLFSFPLTVNVKMKLTINNKIKS